MNWNYIYRWFQSGPERKNYRHAPDGMERFIDIIIHLTHTKQLPQKLKYCGHAKEPILPLNLVYLLNVFGCKTDVKYCITHK